MRGEPSYVISTEKTALRHTVSPLTCAMIGTTLQLLLDLLPDLSPLVDLLPLLLDLLPLVLDLLPFVPRLLQVWLSLQLSAAGTPVLLDLFQFLALPFMSKSHRKMDILPPHHPRSLATSSPLPLKMMMRPRTQTASQERFP